MSKEQEKAIQTMSSNVNIGIDEVVSVFVTKYEDTLFDRKKDLSSKIKETKAEVKDLSSRLEASVETAQYATEMPVLGLVSTVEGVNVHFNDKLEKCLISVAVEVADTDNSGYRSTITKSFDTPISKADVDEHNSLEAKLADLNTELLEVMGLIKSVSRKERQVRGKISEMKLKESGFEGLLENPDMLALIQLD